MQINDWKVLTFLAFFLGALLGASLAVPELQNWQGLFDTFVSASLVVIGFFFVQAQMKNARDIANDAVVRKRLAVRAILPLYLAEISAYTKLIISDLVQAHRFFSAGGTHHAPLPLPVRDLSPDVIEVVKEMIEYAEPPIRDFAAAILIRLQILKSRLEDIRGFVSGGGE